MKPLTDWSIEEKHALIQKKGGDKAHLLDILLELQQHSGQNYIDKDTMMVVADTVGIGYAQMYEILRFYSMLENKPTARYLLEICNSSPCYYSKADQIAGFLSEELGIGVGETTEDNLFSMVYTPCVGACEIGPVIKIQDHVYGNLDRKRVHNLIAELRSKG